MAEPLWQPSADAPARTNMGRFLAHVAAAEGGRIGTYDELHAFSITEIGRFWSHLWDFARLVGEKGPAPYLVAGDRMPGARFFSEARISYAENMLRKTGSGRAMVFRGEDKVQRTLTWNEVHGLVAKTAAALREAGVEEGDRVAGMMPNLPETIIAMLATNAIGAVWSSCSPDFGVQGVLDRFGQIEPKVLIGCDGYYYNGKTIDISEKLSEIVGRLPTVEQTILVSYIGKAREQATSLGAKTAGRALEVVTWDDAVGARAESHPEFKRLAFSHPLVIMFSSGTTGAPKCIVHSAGGTLLKHVSEHLLHSDVHDGDRVFYFTTCGWMMWNWLASGLGCGATLLLYDGSPFHPSGNVLFDFARDERMTHFGTSAKYIDALKKAELRPRDTHDLSALRVMLSTGSPLSPEGFDYVYEAVKLDIQLASISGGTDIIGCFVLGNPLKPVWRGEIQGSALGLASDVFDEDGRPLSHGKGELVCRKPFPSMPVGFWNDPDGRKYRAAYFDRFENIWHHGDFAEWTKHGGMIIHGRSDATLNPGGVRIGTAEIYRQVEMLPEIQEAIVIGQSWDSDVRVVLFVVMRPGHVLDDALRDRIRKQIRTGASPRHVPAKIVAVKDIPRTKSGKITELAVRDIVHGREVKNKEALANPEALDLYRDMAELQS